jgi:fructokinase
VNRCMCDLSATARAIGFSFRPKSAAPFPPLLHHEPNYPHDSEIMTFPVVLCTGEMLYDRIADQPGCPIDAVQSWTDYAGGAPANVACALVKLGTPAGFIGAVGQDDLGDGLVALLDQVGVDTTAVQRIANAPTRTVLVLRSETGDRSFAAFGDNYPTTDFADTKLVAELLPIKLFAHAQYLVLGTLEMAYPQSQAAIAQSLQLAREYGLRVVLDVNWRPVFWLDAAIAPPMILDLIRQVDYLKLSDEESDWLFQTIDPSQIAGQFPHLQAVLITAGEKGCTYWWAGNLGNLPAFAVPAIDTTGAGDSFLAGFVHQLAQMENVTNSPTENTRRITHDIITYASAAGALTTIKPGAIAAQPSDREIREFLKLGN